MSGDIEEVNSLVSAEPGASQAGAGGRATGASPPPAVSLFVCLLHVFLSF